MQRYRFIDNDGSFRLEGAENDRGLYFPIAGEGGLKCAITPNLCGDAKIDQNHFILEPTSIMDLAEKRQSRNFWCRINGKKIWSATGICRCSRQIIESLDEGSEHKICITLMERG